MPLVSKAPTAVLSTTAKARLKAKREAEKEKKEGESGASKPSTAAEGAAEGGAEAMDTGAEGDKEKEPKAESAPEAVSEALHNPARVVPAQEKFIRFQNNARGGVGGAAQPGPHRARAGEVHTLPGELTR
eukprot:1185018-Prorocentrum_minimum.AAC.1